MESGSEIQWRRLPIAKGPAHLQRVIELLHNQALPTEEGFHRPRVSAVRACPDGRNSGFSPSLCSGG
jgi:hypothetical protein